MSYGRGIYYRARHPVRWNVFLAPFGRDHELMGSTPDREHALRIAKGIMETNDLGESHIKIDRIDAESTLRLTVAEARQMFI